MNSVMRGLLSAAGAGLLLSFLLWIQGALGVLPALDLIGMLARVLGEERDAAWVLYAAVTMLGFGLALPVLADDDGQAMVPALGLAATGWFTTMMALLPMAGFSPFGLGLGWAVPVLTLVQAAAFGLALGFLFEQLPGRSARAVAGEAEEKTDAPVPAAALPALQPALAVQPAMAAATAPAPVAVGRPRPRETLRAARSLLTAALQRIALAADASQRQSLPSGRA